MRKARILTVAQMTRNVIVWCVLVALKTANTEKSGCNARNASFGHMRPAQTETLDFIFVITVTLMMISSRIKVTQGSCFIHYFYICIM